MSDVAAELIEIDGAGAQDGHRVLVLDQRQQQMLERRILMPTLIGVGESAMQGLFEITRQH